MDITISIVSFNTKDLLRKCLKNILSQGNNLKTNVWIVDNASEDGSALMVENEFPDLNLIKNSENVGFGKAHNQVLKKSTAEFNLILNPDTEIPKDAISKMALFMEKFSDCGIASCKIAGFDGKLQSNGGDFPTGLALITWLFNLELLGNLPNFHRKDQAYYQKPRETDWVGGTFMVIKKDVFGKIGYFNEDFFMYFEDTELCYRAKKAGFKIMINPEVYVKHISGASSKDPRFNQWKGEFQGLIYFYNKYFGSTFSRFVRLLIYITTTLRILAFLVTGRFSTAKTYGKVLFSV